MYWILIPTQILTLTRIISRNLKLGGYRKMLGRCNQREAQIYTPLTLNKYTFLLCKQKKIHFFVSRGGSLPSRGIFIHPMGGVKTSLTLTCSPYLRIRLKSSNCQYEFLSIFMIYQLVSHHSFVYLLDSVILLPWFSFEYRGPWSLPFVYCRYWWMSGGSGPVPEWTLRQCAWFIPVPVQWRIWSRTHRRRLHR